MISGIILSPIFDSSEIELTIFEKIDHENQTSNLEILVQNVGNKPSTDIILFVDSKEPYEIINFKTTDTQPEIQVDDKLRVEIPRLSPQTYLAIQATGKAIPVNKDVWVTTNQETERINVPAIGLDIGISSVDISKERNIAYLGIFVFGLIALLGFRYYNFYRSEFTRREYLGVYNIPLVRFKSSYLIMGFTILLGTIGAGVIIDSILQPEIIDNYIAFEYFQLNDDITLDTFRHLDTRSYDFITWGLVIMVLSYFPMHVLANKDINIPNFIWSLSRKPDKILLSEIESSFIPSETVAVNTTKKLSDIQTEIITVTENNKIIGLISKNVVEKSKIKDGGKLKKVFTETKRSTNKKSLKIDRNNFVEILHTKTLADLKEEMEKNHMKYAIIANEKNEGIGVVSYDDLFGTPRIFQ